MDFDGFFFPTATFIREIMKEVDDRNVDMNAKAV